MRMSSRKINRILRVVLAFSAGFLLGQAYYYYLLKQIPFPDYLGTVVLLIISGILGKSMLHVFQLQLVDGYDVLGAFTSVELKTLF